MWRIKYFFKNIKNIIRWIPVIWKDHDWDSFYIFDILKFKLKNTAKYLKKNNLYVGVDRDVEIINTCIRLIDKVQSEEYLWEFVEKLEKEHNNGGIFYWNEDRKAYELGALKHEKAKRILFTLLERNIEKWWD